MCQSAPVLELLSRSHDRSPQIPIVTQVTHTLDVSSRLVKLDAWAMSGGVDDQAGAACFFVKDLVLGFRVLEPM